MPEGKGKVYPSEVDILENIDNGTDEEEEEECENAVPEELQHKRKKSLLEFRCRVEDSILNNYLLDKSMVKAHKLNESLRDISLWGVPLLPSKNHPGTDVILMKFLKAKDYKVSDAFNMLRRALKWRRTFKVDEVLNEKFGSDLENVGYINGADRTGHPLCYNIYEPFKNKDIHRNILRATEQIEEFFRWRVQFMERCIEKLDFSSGGASSFVLIIDLTNVPRLAAKGILGINKKTMSLLQDYYPGLIFRTIIINVPMWFLACHTLRLQLATQRWKWKFILARPGKVTETLLQFIAPENIPVQYGGLHKENDNEFSPDDKVVEHSVRGNACERIEIPIAEGGMTISWEMTVVETELNYKEEFVPEDDCSYDVLIQKGKQIGKSVSNSFHITEPGKIVITFENATSKRRRVFLRYKIKPTVPMYTFYK